MHYSWCIDYLNIDKRLSRLQPWPLYDDAVYQTITVEFWRPACNWDKLHCLPENINNPRWNAELCHWSNILWNNDGHKLVQLSVGSRKAHTCHLPRYNVSVGVRPNLELCPQQTATVTGPIYKDSRTLRDWMLNEENWTQSTKFMSPCSLSIWVSCHRKNH